MTQSLRVHLLAAGAAIVLGVAGDGLLRVHPLGLNLTLWTVSILIAAFVLSRLHKTVPVGAYGLLGAAILLSLTFAWRDSVTLKWLSLFAAFTSFALAAKWGKAFQIRLAGVVTYALAMLEGAVLMVRGAPVLAVRGVMGRDSEWRQLAGEDARAWVFAPMRGLLIAVPLVFVFGGLFASADAAYRTVLSDLFDLRELVRHAAITLLCAWIAASMLEGILEGNTVRLRLPAATDRVRLGAIEAGVVLTLLDLLFLSFAIVQFRYLFGGEERIRRIADLTYSQYARQGFFELCAVVALVLGVLLLGDWLVRDATAKGKRIFTVLAVLQLLMVEVIMASAFLRMWMYQDAYGLTELRLYATAFMCWLGVLLVWFLLTVILRGERRRFAFGAYLTGLAAVLALHAIDPDALIVRTNAARLDRGKPFDAEYALRLSADAVPALVSFLPRLDEAGRSQIAGTLRTRWLDADPLDWRAWSWGRACASRSIREHATLIGSVAPPVRDAPDPARRDVVKAEPSPVELMVSVGEGRDTEEGDPLVPR